MMSLQNKAEREFGLRTEEMQLKRQEMEFQKEMHLKPFGSKIQLLRILKKCLSIFKPRTQQLMQQHQQYQQMQMKQAQQQKQMMQQQSKLEFTLLEKMCF